MENTDKKTNALLLKYVAKSAKMSSALNQIATMTAYAATEATTIGFIHRMAKSALSEAH